MSVLIEFEAQNFLARYLQAHAAATDKGRVVLSVEDVPPFYRTSARERVAEITHVLEDRGFLEIVDDGVDGLPVVRLLRKAFE